MHSAGCTPKYAVAALFLAALTAFGQPPEGQSPEFVQAQQFLRQGKLEYALAIYTDELKNSPGSYNANMAAGQILDLLGKGAEARRHLAQAIESANTPALKAQAQRSMAMSYAFDGDCRKAGEYEQHVLDYWAAQKDFYQQGEIANEAGRVCIEAGDLDAAAAWYKKGRDLGLQEPNLAVERRHLWEFRWEHAQARIAARRGQREEAERHVAAARAVLDGDPKMAEQQSIFFPYLKGYVALYVGAPADAVASLLQANQNDPFIQCLLGEAYEKLGDRAKAMECYKKAAATTAHNPPAAYARPFARKKLG